ncbi:hypothetical protein ACS0PU_005390 [Formica fusca]
MTPLFAGVGSDRLVSVIGPEQSRGTWDTFKETRVGASAHSLFHVNNTRAAAKASSELRPPRHCRRYQRIFLYVVSVPSRNLDEDCRRHHQTFRVEEKKRLVVKEGEEDVRSY